MKGKVMILLPLSTFIMGILFLVSACSGLSNDNIIFSESEPISGKFLTLNEAYDSGLVTAESVESVATLYNSGKTSETVIDEYVEKTIKSDYAEEKGIKTSDVNLSYYGEYSGTYIVCMSGSGTETSDEIIFDIAGVSIKQRVGEEIKVWAQTGDFISLREAYDNALLNVSELKSIAYFYNGEGETKNLDYITDKSIRRDWLSKSCHLGNNEKGDIDKVTIGGYFGTYNGCVAVYIEDEYSMYVDCIAVEAIGGVNFYYNNGNRIRIWKNK